MGLKFYRHLRRLDINHLVMECLMIHILMLRQELGFHLLNRLRKQFVHLQHFFMFNQNILNKSRNRTLYNVLCWPESQEYLLATQVFRKFRFGWLQNKDKL